MPRRVKPMLATPVDKPFDRKDWVFEIKWDGFRAIAEVEPKKGVRLHSRNLISLADRFPPVVDALRRLGHRAVLDGEIVALDKKGRSSFQLLQDFRDADDLRYAVFDLLHLDGRDLRKLPLLERKALLKRLVRGLPGVIYADHVAERGRAFARAAARLGLEGVMAKDAHSPYRPGVRGLEWLKIKTHTRQEAVIAGFTAPRRSRSHFGALVLGVYEKGKLVYIGHTGGGFDERALAELHAKLGRRVRKTSPFSLAPKTNAPVTWVRPELVCEIEFNGWTGEGHMRQPVFLGLRPDKRARDVGREVPKRLFS